MSHRWNLEKGKAVILVLLKNLKSKHRYKNQQKLLTNQASLWLCAVRNTKKEYKPQIAKINKVNGTAGNVNITWLDGTYDSNWKVWKTGGRIIKDTVPIHAILTQVEF